MSDQLEQQDQLIEEYREYADRLVRALMKRFNLPSREFNDLVSAGYLGLVEAARRYDAERYKGVKFESFAYLRVRGAVIDFIRQSAQFDRRAYEQFKALEASHDYAEERVTVRCRTDSAPEDEVSALLSEAAGYLTIARLTHLRSEDLSAEDSSTPIEVDSSEDQLLRRERFRALHRAIQALPEAEKGVIYGHYIDGKSFKQLRTEDGTRSKSWVSRLHSRGIDLLRLSLMREGGRDAFVTS